MAQEVKITKYVLEDCKGNMNVLVTEWAGVPRISETTILKSRGHTAKSVRDCLEMTKQIDNSMQQLLENSVEFLRQAGVSFQEADAAAAQNIENLTG